MRKILIALLVLLPSIICLGQVLDNYHLSNDSDLYKKDNSTTPLSNSIFEILTIGDTIWLGTLKGLSRSLDGGTTWKNYYGTSEFGDEAVLALKYHKGEIWATTYHSEEFEFETEPVPMGTGIRVSSDGGETWRYIKQPTVEKSDTTIIYGDNQLYAVAVDTTAKNYCYDIDFSKDAVWITTFAAGLKKSVDNGKTWQRVVLPPDSLDYITPSNKYDFQLSPPINLNQRAFSLMVDDSNRIWCGTAGGINVSNDEGVSWKKFSHQNQINPISGNHVVDIKYNSFDNSVWAVTRKTMDPDEFYGLSVSKDYGQSWTTYLPGAQGYEIQFRNYMSSDDIESYNVLFATNEGFFRSNKLYDTWFLAPEIKDDRSNIKINSNFFQAIASQNNLDGSAELWFGTTDGLARLIENGNMWEGEWTVFLASENIAETGETFAFPNPFAPGLESTNIKYSTGEQGGNVTIRILDFGMNLVKTVVQNVYRNGKNENIDTWNGYDEHNNQVANGVYFYRIDISSNDPLYGKIMVMR